MRRLRIAQEDDQFEYFGLFDHCGCEKIDGKLWMWHGCEDAWVDVPKKSAKGKRKTGRAYRRRMRVQKFNRHRMIVESTNTMAMWLGYSETVDDEKRPAYVRRMKHSKRKKFLKRCANKMFRRTDSIGMERAFHRKVYDVAWEMW